MEPKGKFLFVINPIAGGNDKAELTEAVRDYAANAGSRADRNRNYRQ